MRFFAACLFIACFILFSCHIAIAQNTDKDIAASLAKKLDYYRLKKQGGVLYAHFDKTIYTNNENVWFTAYLLNNDNTTKDNVLSVALVKDNNRSVMMEEKFVMADNLSLGNLFLPDTIPPGDYSFILYTNNLVNDKPANVFIQSVTIKNTSEASFNATLDLLDTVKFPAEGKRKVLLVTNAKGVKIISGASVNYYVGNKLHPLISGNVKTDKYGQYLFNIPVKGVTSGNNILEAQITYGKEIKNARLILPVYRDKPIVRFYPEGGNLSDGIISTVGWEVKNLSGNPYKVTGVLYKDGQATDTIATNSYGMGRFRLTPSKGSHYYMKLLLTDILKDSVYNLPQPVPDIPVVSIKNALANDTLNLVIKNKQTRNVYVAVHNYKGLFFLFPVIVGPGGKTVKIILDAVPKGIAEITILDSLQRPFAERLFFAHYDQHNNLSITTNGNEYKIRQKVTVNLKLRNQEGKPITGFVSIACVQANRFELKKANDIVSYFYLENELGRLPVKENYMGYSNEDKAWLEDLLLIKGWRRYTWTELVGTKAKDTIKQKDSIKFKGTVTYFGEKLTKAVELVLLKDSLLKVNTLSTNSTGNFIISNDRLSIAENKKVHLLVTGKDIYGYNISVDDPYKKINRLMAADYESKNYYHVLQDQKNDDEENLKGVEHVIHLKEVKIKGGNDNTIYGKGVLRSNACGDYVCIYNILNCPNHRDDLFNREPVKGGSYTYKGQSGYIYQGCMVDPYDHSSAINGIQYAMEFYLADYSQLNPPEPEFLSTIYWKHLYKISPENNGEISFYTSDITGVFKIIVQGISENEVVSGGKTIMVNKP